MAEVQYLREMLGDDIFDAVTAAQTRLGDSTVTARCAAGLWLIERGGADVHTGLTPEGCVESLAALT